MTLRVTAVEVLSDYRLRLSFDDGSVTLADFSDDLWGPLCEPLRDPAYFARASVDPESRTVVWPNGYDPSPEVLHGDAPAAPPSRLHITKVASVQRAS
jgi:Protein of unknown function (DUF2442)